MDLRLTADNEIVLLHDQSLERTTSGQGPVGEKSLSEIRQLEAGSWFDPSFSDQRVPTLKEVLDLVQERRRAPTLLVLDVKDQTMEEAVCGLVEEYGLLDQVVVIGSVTDSVELRRCFKAVNPCLPTAVKLNAPEEWETGLEDDSSNWLYVRFLISAVQVTEAHRAGKRILAAGPIVMSRQVGNWHQVWDAGIDALLTDYPLECRDSWRRRG